MEKTDQYKRLEKLTKEKIIKLYIATKNDKERLFIAYCTLKETDEQDEIHQLKHRCANEISAKEALQRKVNDGHIRYETSLEIIELITK